MFIINKNYRRGGGGVVYTFGKLEKIECGGC